MRLLTVFSLLLITRIGGCRGFKGPSPSTTLDKDVVLFRLDADSSLPSGGLSIVPPSGGRHLEQEFSGADLTIHHINAYPEENFK